MNDLIVITYKMPTDEWTRKMYEADVDYIYDSVAFHNDAFAEIELKKLRRKYTEVDSFVCSLAAYNDFVDNEVAYEEFVRTGVCPLKPVTEDVDVGTDHHSEQLYLMLELRRTDDSAEFDYSINVDELGQIVFTPKNSAVAFTDIRRVAGYDSTEDNVEGNIRTLGVKLVADMISEDNNFDWFVDIDEIGQAIVTPDKESTSFLSVSVEGSLNLVTESENFVESAELDLAESRDFEWTAKELYAVVKDDGTYAGIPCISYEEARELSTNHEGSKIFRLILTVTEELTEDVDHQDIVNKVLNGDIPVFSGEGEPESRMIHIPELDTEHGQLKFEYYYHEDSDSVISYSRSR